jgi:hypothetical protein
MAAAGRFWYGFGLALSVAFMFNALSVLRAWFYPGCADCIVSAGVPFPFISHGGFVTETFIIWRGVRDNLAAVATVAVMGGLVSVRMLRS